MTWTNWAGNQSFFPASTAAPRDEEEVAALVRRPPSAVTGYASRAQVTRSPRSSRPTGCCSTSPPSPASSAQMPTTGGRPPSFGHA